LFPCRFSPEKDDGANAGLGIERDVLQEVKRAHPELSYADIWTLAGAHAIEIAGGPPIDHRLGRTDASDGSSCPAIGRLPDASKGAEHLREVFYRMGFNDEDIVALSGAHTLGRCHKTRSGFDGPWTQDPLKFDNTYFQNLLNLDWKPRAWEGPLQYEDPSKKLMMLPTDIALKTDPKFKKWAQLFAKDEAAFRASFKKAYERLLSLGCPENVVPGGTDSSSPSQSEVESRAILEHCMHGSLEHAQAARAAGGNPKWIEPHSNRTALHKAAFWGHAHIVPWLLSAEPNGCGLDPNLRDYNGDTALHDAARFGHSEVIKQLLDHGASTKIKNNKGQTPSAAALENGKDLAHEGLLEQSCTLL